MRSQLVLFILAVLLTACVPSPTATPPRATPFPTLPLLPTDTPLPTLTLTPPPTLAATARPSAAPTLTALPLPSPRASATATLAPAPATISAVPTLQPGVFAPLVQVFPSDLSGPVSAGQIVSLGVLAVDNAGVAQVQLYDEKKLYSSTSAPSPAPTFFSAILPWKTDRVGPHHLSVVALDSAGNASAPVELTFDVLNDNRRPTAQFTNLVGATDVQVGAPVQLQGVATDEVAITRVDLIVDDSFYTYVVPDQSAGESPFAFRLMWVPPSPGIHRLYLRAHDNQNQTGDSPVLLVNALAVQPPALAVRYENDQVAVNGALLVYTLALSPNGVTRVELWADDQMMQAVNSSSVDGQAVIDTPLVWEVPALPGDHLLLVRAYDRMGLSTSAGPQLIHVRPQGAVPPPPTVPAATLAPTPLAPTPTASPAVLVPAPPTIALIIPQDAAGVLFPASVHFTMQMKGSAELDHVEAWTYYQGETTPALVFEDTVKGATDKTLSFDWQPPRAGTAYIYARVVDHLGQIGQSSLLNIALLPPPAPTATPALPGLAARWTATIPTNQFAVSFVQIGRALRGSFVNTPLNAQALTGQIAAGSINKDRLGFVVYFFAPGVAPRSLQFDCLVGSAPSQLTCNYQDEAGNRGSAIFTPAP